MATKVVYTVREDKHGLQKQVGCMNGIFHLLDRGYLLGLQRHSRNQNRLTQGQGEKSEKELKKPTEKAKEKNQKKMMIENNRASVESSRNSFSSSSSSTTFSSFDCGKRVQTEWQLPSEPASPNLHIKQPEWSQPPPDIRDVVKDSMTRVIRVTKAEQTGSVMKHIDSPRPFIQQSSVQYERKDQNLAKIQKISSAVKEVKEKSRFSCDERESQYSLNSSFKVKELPRLSLDSKQNSKTNSLNKPRSEPGSNRRPSSIVARLMGLDSLRDSICEVETLKMKPAFNDQMGSCSPKMHSKIKPDSGSYGEIEKRLSALEFKTSGKDLRALKQIVEAMQMANTGFENKEQSLDSQKNDPPGSPSVKGTSSPKRHELLNRAMKPGKIATEPMMVTGLNYANHKARKQVQHPTPRNNKATGRTSRSVEDLTGEKPVSSPRLQRSKNGIDKQGFNGRSSDSSRIKKQPTLKTRHSKIKPMNPMQNNDQSCMYSNETRNISQDGAKVNTCKSESKQKVTRVSEKDFRERLEEDKPMVELAKLTMEQASPVSVLDAFYVEDIPSPVKKKPDAFNAIFLFCDQPAVLIYDYDNLRIDETEWNHVGMYNLVTSTDAAEFNQIELLNYTYGDGAKSQCTSTCGDHKYIREVLLASGFLNDPDSAIRIAQLHSTGTLIKPGLFHILETTNYECHKMNPIYKSNDKVRRKLVFDSVNDILFHKLAMSGFCGKRCGKFVDGEKLLTEIQLEIDNLQSTSKRCVYDEDDEVKILVSADVNKNSQDWDTYCYEVPGLVLDIERLIFKDLIDEIVHDDAAGVQDRQGRHYKRLFSM